MNIYKILMLLSADCLPTLTAIADRAVITEAALVVVLGLQ